MKSLIVLALVSTFAPAYAADTIECRANGATAGIVKISAVTMTDGRVESSVVQKTATGELKTLSKFVSGGSFAFEFAVLAQVDNGPYGFVQTLLRAKPSFEGTSYVLVTRVLCNPSYQEETCWDGPRVTGESEDAAVACGN